MTKRNILETAFFAVVVALASPCFEMETRLCPDKFLPRHDCAHMFALTRLCPDMFMPGHKCAHTWLCSHDLVHIRLCPFTINCAYTPLWPDTIVPIHDRAHSTVPKQDCRHIQLSRHKNVPWHNYCTHEQ